MKDKRNFSQNTQKTAVRIFCLILAGLMVLGTFSYILYVIV